VPEKEPAKVTITHLPSPIRCVLWELPDRVGGKLSNVLDEVETYEDSSHLTRS